MRLLEGYLYVLQKLNKLTTNSNQKIAKYHFVQSFNRAQYTWLDFKLRQEEANETIQRQLRQLLTQGENLKLKSKKDIYSLYELPLNYYHTSNIIGYSNGCKVDISEVEEGNAASLWFNDMSAPSLEFEQSFASFESKYLKVYKKNFEFTKVNLTYYRRPNKVDLASGFINADGNESKNIDTEWEDSNLYEILDIVVKDISLDIMDAGRFQLMSQATK